MRLAASGALISTLALTACTSFQPNEWERNPNGPPLQYPLSYCAIPGASSDDPKKIGATPELDKARQLMQEVRSTNANRPEMADLHYDSSWVCRTRMVEPAKQTPGETAAAFEARRLALSAIKDEAEQTLRARLEGPFTRYGTGRPELGIALSGGGTKAASFGAGVLAGLSDLDLLDRADFISTVSGGGYAAYFYYAQHVFPQTRTHLPGVIRLRPTSEHLYRDCVSVPPAGSARPEVFGKITQVGGCSPGKLLVDEGPAAFDNRYQAFLKCQQDVFKPGRCTTTIGKGNISIQWQVVAGTALAVLPAFVSSTLFDWGNTLSPAARTYRDGIGIAYGSTVDKLSTLAKGETGGTDTPYFELPCEPSSGSFALDCTPNTFNPDPVPLTFPELRQAYLNARATGKPMPFWILNAAAPKRRSVFGWVAPVPQELSNADIYEMTAVSQGSARYGYITASPEIHRMSVLDSVTASAAFMDPSNLKEPALRRGLTGLGMHLLANDWGQDIPNFNTSDNRRRLHRALPFPFYWLDSLVARHGPRTRQNEEEEDRARSTYIRLIDGGNAENLGAFSLVKRGVKNIVISDAASDTDGDFFDVCGLRERMKPSPAGTASQLYIPGLDKLDRFCDQRFDPDSAVEPQGFDVRDWRFDEPLLVGCLRATTPSDSREPCHGLQLEGEGAKDSRLFIAKPAVNLDAFAMQVDRGGLTPVINNCWVRGHKQFPSPQAGVLNCDTTAYMLTQWEEEKGRCQVFPQHSTPGMTMDSNHRRFMAYRELGRQYVAHSVLKALASGTAQEQVVAFERQASLQYAQRLFSRSIKAARQTCAPRVAHVEEPRHR